MKYGGYEVLARKYRPRRFADVVGQQHIARTLVNSIRTGRLAHALIFNGPRGVGKTSMARILAKSLNCEQLADGDVEPCNACANCRAIDAGSFLDVIEMDAASNRGIDDMRAVVDEVYYAPSMGRRKLYIVDEFHMLTREAFNAFLKTLEEPPEHAVFVLATTDLHRVNATIISRCQRHDFRRIGVSDMLRALESVLEAERADWPELRYEPQALELVARSSEGCMRDAESLLDRLLSYSGGDLSLDAVSDVLGVTPTAALLELLRAVRDGDAPAIYEQLQRLDDRGIEIDGLNRQLIAICRDLYLATQQVQDPTRDEQAHQALAELADFDPGRLEVLYSLLRQCHFDMKQSPYPRFDLEFALLKAAHTLPMVQVDALVQALQSDGPPEHPAAAVPDAGVQKKKSDAPVATDEIDVQRRLIDSLGEEDPPLAGLLRNMRLRADGDGGYVLLAMPTQMGLLDGSRIEQLQALLARITGRECKLRVEQSSAGESLNRHDERQRSQRERELRKELERDPLYRQFAERFGGEIVEFRALPNTED